jgi:hypothetical protein
MTTMDLADWTGNTSDEALGAGTSIYSVEKAKQIVALFAEVTTRRNVADFVSEGVEFREMQGDRISRWDATAASWDADR